MRGRAERITHLQQVVDRVIAETDRCLAGVRDPGHPVARIVGILRDIAVRICALDEVAEGVVREDSHVP